MQKITTFLMYESGAGEAMDFYASVFKNSKIISKMPGPGGEVMGGTIEIEGQLFNTYNGGPHFKFSEAMSLFVSCADQQEVDYYWEKLTADGGEESMCGWLKDKFGVSWQIIPVQLMQMIGAPDRAKADRAIQAMLQMRKIDIQKLEEAFNQK